MSGMEHEKIIFIRNFFSPDLLLVSSSPCSISLRHACFGALRSRGRPRLFLINEREFGKLVLLFFIELRVVIVFFFLVPALALHWMARKK